MSHQSKRYSNKTTNVRHLNSETKQESRSAKRLADCLPYLVKMTPYQLKQLKIHPDGEFHNCTSGKEALDIVNHIKGVFRSRGFGCYALHNYVWIVPFVHQSLHVPDFERAKDVLPDLKGELLGKAFPDEEPVELNPVMKKNPWDFKSIMILLMFLLFVLGFFF